ncbi:MULTISPECIES: HD domain-containing protein [Ralstonia]|jgi:hypothetical protein|uniref:HD domain-containing protein n=8 Tax=Pseudomonadota TaxID=1224 RepID=A0AAD2F353_9RALS|nr:MULTISPECIES: HD domain-containing protein [Ralstonia]NOZ17924.1 HD domain-containing protein [Betaproteobacteria bacterium]AJW47559.1 hypothetical protein TK49_22740 [Ralstonia mannitolilytica]MBA9871378.1 HD domain-containing protein [Ralstonia insidiosa]MBA9915632.1 HD domain-containing protein [Ralstonia insidiosa]MBA9954623.1 HD domain-containing protein [Ralstonia insidiosa]
MRNELLKSVLIVFLFWFIVLTVAALPDLQMLRATAIRLGVIWSGGVLLGTGFWLLRRAVRGAPGSESAEQSIVTATIMSDPQTKSTQSVPLPAALLPAMAHNIGAALSDTRTGQIAQNLMQRYPWWNAYAAKNPLHAAALLDVWRILLSKQDLPAAPVPQDHGGATLVEHTLNVLDGMLELAPAWRYEGVRDTKGKVVVPVADVNRGFHVFDKGDPVLNPMLVLAAVAHDIGKVECYRQVDPKRPERVEEVAPNHGEMGAKMLRGVPSLMNLSIGDRQALILAVSYYHHMSDMPIAGWMGDLPRSLMMLLYEADCLASWREGGRDEEKMRAGSVTQRAAKGDAAQRSQASVQDMMPQEDDDAPAFEHDDLQEDPNATATEEARHLIDRARAAAPAREHKRKDATEVNADVARPYWKHPTGRTPLDFLTEALTRDSAINGRSTQKRLAIWSAPWLYVLDQKMRTVMEPDIGDTSAPRGQMSSFTKELLAQLEAKGWLYNNHEGVRLSHKRALWLCDMGGDNQVAMLVVSDECIPKIILTNAGGIKEAPQIVRPLWGATSAINKRGGSVDDGDISETPEPPATAGEARMHLKEVESEREAPEDSVPAPQESDVFSVLPPGFGAAIVESDEPDDPELALPPRPILDLYRLRQDVMEGKFMPEKHDDGTVLVAADLVWTEYEQPRTIPEGMKLVLNSRTGTKFLRFKLA